MTADGGVGMSSPMESASRAVWDNERTVFPAWDDAKEIWRAAARSDARAALGAALAVGDLAEVIGDRLRLLGYDAGKDRDRAVAEAICLHVLDEHRN